MLIDILYGLGLLMMLLFIVYRRNESNIFYPLENESLLSFVYQFCSFLLNSLSVQFTLLFGRPQAYIMMPHEVQGARRTIIDTIIDYLELIIRDKDTVSVNDVHKVIANCENIKQEIIDKNNEEKKQKVKELKKEEFKKKIKRIWLIVLTFLLAIPAIYVIANPSQYQPGEINLAIGLLGLVGGFDLSEIF